MYGTTPTHMTSENSQLVQYIIMSCSKAREFASSYPEQLSDPINTNLLPEAAAIMRNYLQGGISALVEETMSVRFGITQGHVEYEAGDNVNSDGAQESLRCGVATRGLRVLSDC